LARSDENTGFLCDRCGTRVPPLGNGSYRNHCPGCLWSKHLDASHPGDRASDCGGAMRPIDVVRSKKGWQVVHRCERCGVVRRNRTAESTAAPDDIRAMIAVMQYAAAHR